MERGQGRGKGSQGQGRGKKSWGGVTGTQEGGQGQGKGSRDRGGGHRTSGEGTRHGDRGQRQGRGERAWPGDLGKVSQGPGGGQGQRSGDRARYSHDTSQMGSEQTPRGWGEVTEPGLCGARGEVTGRGSRGGCDSRVSPQAKYLAQIILVGAQVVGRAFMRALRQEFAGRSWDCAPWAPRCPAGHCSTSPPFPGHPSAAHPRAVPAGDTARLSQGSVLALTALPGSQKSWHPKGQSGVIPGMWQPQPCL